MTPSFRPLAIVSTLALVVLVPYFINDARQYARISDLEQRNEALSKLCGVPHITSALTVQAPAQAARPTEPKMQWQRRQHTPWDSAYDLVGVGDRRIYAGVTNDKGTWSVWHNGAGFGEYTSEQAAKLHAETIARELGDRTWQ